MKHLKEIIAEGYNLTPRGRKFFAELNKSGLMADQDGTGLAFLQTQSGWSLAIETEADYFDFYLPVEKNTVMAGNDETEEERPVNIKDLELSHDHPKNIDGEPCFDYSKKNAQLLAELLLAIE